MTGLSKKVSEALFRLAVKLPGWSRNAKSPELTPDFKKGGLGFP